jgi:hypothetical protein
MPNSDAKSLKTIFIWKQIENENYSGKCKNESIISSYEIKMPFLISPVV